MNEESIQEEIDFVIKVITHPAGYDLDVAGSLCVRPTDQGVWCVSWETVAKNWTMEMCFPTAREAADLFVKKRHEDQLGLDY